MYVHIDKRLKEVNREIRKASPKRHNYTLAGGFVVCLVILVSVAVYWGPGITGFATFSQTTAVTQSEDFTVSSSGVVRVRADLDELNALLVSGTVYGQGSAAVYLLKDGRKHLVYYFEGDAQGGVDFQDMCYGTCHIEGLKSENELLFELDGTLVHIDSIRYMYSKLIDFRLEPELSTIDYPAQKAMVVDLTLTNDELTDYKVLIYIDGPLSDHFSIEDSLVEMTSDIQEKSVPVTVKLPSDLPKGTYDHKVTARFIPPSDLDFQGESPVSESMITIVSG